VGQSYERDLQDVLALQNELARTIAAKFQIQLTRKAGHSSKQSPR